MTNEQIKEIALAKALPDSHWISVKDRLPKYKDSYLVFVKMPWQETRVVIFCPTVGFYSNGKVTHWQPLPEPPKGVDYE